MVVSAWVLAGVLVWAAVLAAIATRVPALEPPVRTAVNPLVMAVAVLVVADLALVLSSEPADRPDSMLTHVGYAVASVGLIPLLTVRHPSSGDPDAEVEPASLWVLAVGLVAVAVCLVRLVQTR